jgi:hypothetical protein
MQSNDTRKILLSINIRSPMNLSASRAIRSFMRTVLRRIENDHDLQAIAAQAELANRVSDDLLELQSWPQLASEWRD